jgi:hypothetical protein
MMDDLTDKQLDDYLEVVAPKIKVDDVETFEQFLEQFHDVILANERERSEAVWEALQELLDAEWMVSIDWCEPSKRYAVVQKAEKALTDNNRGRGSMVDGLGKRGNPFDKQEDWYVEIMKQLGPIDQEKIKALQTENELFRDALEIIPGLKIGWCPRCCHYDGHHAFSCPLGIALGVMEEER